MRTLTAKLGTMRKAVEWVVYPPSAGSSQLTIQSEHRIARFDPVTGKGWMSAHQPSGAYFGHLYPAAGACVVVVPAWIVQAALAVQPKPGDEIGPGMRVG